MLLKQINDCVRDWSLKMNTKFLCDTKVTIPDCKKISRE